MEEKMHRLMNRMQIRHARICSIWYGPVLLPVLLIIGFALLIVGIIILLTPIPGWPCVFATLGILPLVHPPACRLNIQLAAKLDVLYVWYTERHVAMKATLFLLLIAFTAAVVGSACYFMALDAWLHTDASS